MAKAEITNAIAEIINAIAKITNATFLTDKLTQERKYGIEVFTASAQRIPLGIIEQQVWSRKEEELGVLA